MAGPDHSKSENGGAYNDFNAVDPSIVPVGPAPEAQARLGIAYEPEMLVEEIGQLVERDHVHPVVQIDMVGAGDDHEFLRLGRGRVGGFAEIPRMGLFAVDQQDRARRNLLDVGQERHVHER